MAEPFVKAVGGKRQLLPVLEKLLPERFGTFYEPFCGGGALFFRLQELGRLQAGAVLNDRNTRLMMAYEAVRDDVEGVVEALGRLIGEYEAAGPVGYTRAVRRFNASRQGHRHPLKLTAVEHAALYIFLSRSCFNGIHRVNQRGEFNVPHNGVVPSLRDDELRAAAVALRGVVLWSGDFEAGLQGVTTGDLVFGDSPYDETFEDYQTGGFGVEGQRRLAAAFRELDRGGVLWMVTNSDTALVRQLWGGYRLTSSVETRAVNSDGNGRGGAPCLIITNYERTP